MKLVKLPRLYRIMKVTRILKVLKVFNSSLSNKRMLQFLQNSRGRMKLLTLFFTVVIFTHIASCMWVFVARINDFKPDTWVYEENLQDEDSF